MNPARGSRGSARRLIEKFATVAPRPRGWRRMGAATAPNVHRKLAQSIAFAVDAFITAPPMMSALG